MPSIEAVLASAAPPAGTCSRQSCWPVLRESESLSTGTSAPWACCRSRATGRWFRTLTPRIGRSLRYS
ncbi:unnamed protein product [Clonostachys byssicola]|uniref:Uncharacterized protein n=1 Tax=Clonostachys byssicola TaxID=160290 RepID=A0A9N9Y3Y0_9HYPO|nr:unnamed protein product [Clonostachys byssicola]